MRRAHVPPSTPVLQLHSSGGMCMRILAAPGVGGALATLHGAFTLAHLPMSLSAGQLVARAGDGGAAQCSALYAYLVVVVGVLLPLGIAAPLELRERRRLLATYAGQVPPAELQVVQQEHERQSALLAVFTPKNLYLASSLVSRGVGAAWGRQRA